ncbi:MAG: peptidase T, partial [Oscillospiraceae bacterium]|nr:peptidase T [Oscillospiraceae bacterium]
MNIKERFLRYVSFDTTSCEESEAVPSTSRQKIFGESLKEELQKMGLSEVQMDENGYVYAFLPANNGSDDAVGFIAHMDTSSSVSGKDINPEILTYTGGDIKLKKSGEISVAAYPFLNEFVGQELIVTDGTTLLGADDKAGIAEIVT